MREAVAHLATLQFGPKSGPEIWPGRSKCGGAQRRLGRVCGALADERFVGAAIGGHSPPYMDVGRRGISAYDARMLRRCVPGMLSGIDGPIRC